MEKIQESALVGVKIYPHATYIGIYRRETYDDGTISSLEMKDSREHRWIHRGNPEKIISRLSRR
ncbi:hypothetical protein JNK62_04315 [bacterium]|nr:hypothetical protein [bacterium]